MKKTVIWLMLGLGALSVPALATSELCLKFGYVLNKGDQPFYSWLLIQESNYYIKDIISFGYETQFSYYKFTATADPSQPEAASYPLNVFFNSKVKLIRKGIIRPYAGAGYGFLMNIISYPDHCGWEKYQGFQLIAGLSLGKTGKAALQLEFRILNSNKPDSKTKYIFTGGIAY